MKAKQAGTIARRKIGNASVAPARWSGLGEKNVGDMIRVADEGNTDAGRQTVELASRLILAKQPLPEVLRVWLAAQLLAVSVDPDRAGQLLRVTPRVGRSPKASKSMRDRLKSEALEERIAWAVYRGIASKEAPTKANRKGDATIYEIVGKWAGCTEREARRCYENRFAQMEIESARLQEILSEIESPAK